MKQALLRALVIWRRFRRGSLRRNEHQLHDDSQIAVLLSRANPFASWNERANWMVDIAEWLRRDPGALLLDDGARRRIRCQRVRSLLDWLDAHRDVRKLVQATLQKTLREATGPELFSATGLPREPAFFSELAERLIKFMLPRPMPEHDLSALFTAMFPDPVDAGWLLALDQTTLARLARLCTDDGIAHAYLRQIDEALTYLVTQVVAVGVSPDFRQRVGPPIPLQATPFMSLRREVEKYLMGGARDEASLRGVRMLIAVCQAQTDRVYEHLDEYGVSVSLVYRIERMRAQLSRMGRLVALHATGMSNDHGANQLQALLADLISAHHHRSSVPELMRRSFSLLARKMVERNAGHGEHYIARNRGEYRAMLRAACIGGAVTAFTVLGKLAVLGGAVHFFEGLLATLIYGASFVLITMIGGVLATKQPAVTAPALAAKMGNLNSREGLRELLTEIMCLLRSQAAAVFGNLTAVIPVMLLLALAAYGLSGGSLMSPEKAHASMQSLSLLGVTPLFAAFTGVLLWLSSLAAGFADNWFALRQLRSTITHHRRLVHALGPARAARLAQWVEKHVASVVGNLSLAAMLGMGPVLLQFFGMPLDVRHVTLSTGTLTAAVSSLGYEALTTREFWLAGGGILAIGLLNVAVAFACALMLALRARDVPARVRRVVFRAVLRRFTAAPWAFLFPSRQERALTLAPTSEAEKPDTERHRNRKTGS